MRMVEDVTTINPTGDYSTITDAEYVTLPDEDFINELMFVDWNRCAVMSKVRYYSNLALSFLLGVVVCLIGGLLKCP